MWRLSRSDSRVKYLVEESMTQTNPSFKTSLWRGLKGTCPNCGQAKLLRDYLKPVDQCPSCGVRWEHVRADLGPAWASMTVAAHVLVVFYHFVLFRSGLPTWQQITLLCVMAVIICLAVLPRMKGLFMAIVWAKDTQDS